jgi:hypothetical protein
MTTPHDSGASGYSGCIRCGLRTGQPTFEHPNRCICKKPHDSGTLPKQQIEPREGWHEVKYDETGLMYVSVREACDVIEEEKEKARAEERAKMAELPIDIEDAIQKSLYALVHQFNAERGVSNEDFRLIRCFMETRLREIARFVDVKCAQKVAEARREQKEKDATICFEVEESARRQGIHIITLTTAEAANICGKRIVSQLTSDTPESNQITK